MWNLMFFDYTSENHGKMRNWIQNEVTNDNITNSQNAIKSSIDEFY